MTASPWVDLADGRAIYRPRPVSRSCLARVWSCWCGTTLHRRDDLGERAWLARIADHTHHCKEARA